MKFLFDQSADFRLISYLEDLGHDVYVISRHYPHSLPDEDVLAIARREQRVLVVADRDFGQLIVQQHQQHAGVIFFRLPGASLAVKIERLSRALSEHAADLLRGAFLVVTPNQIRIAREPSQGWLVSSPLPPAGPPDKVLDSRSRSVKARPKADPVGAWP